MHREVNEQVNGYIGQRKDRLIDRSRDIQVNGYLGQQMGQQRSPWMHRSLDRQVASQIGCQIGRQIDRPLDIQAAIQIGCQIDKLLDRQVAGQIGCQIDRLLVRQVIRQIGLQTTLEHGRRAQVIKINVTKHTFLFHRPSRARPKAAKAFTPEFRLPRPGIEPLYISSNHTLPLFHTSQPPLSRWQFFKSKSWGQHAYGQTNHICTPLGDGE